MQQLPQAVAFVLGASQGLDSGDQRIELGKLLREFDKGFVVDPGSELRLNRFPAADKTVEFFFWNGCHGFLLRRDHAPARPKVCFPAPHRKANLPSALLKINVFFLGKF